MCEQAGSLPHSEVEFEVREDGELVLRAIARRASSAREAFARVSGLAGEWTRG